MTFSARTGQGRPLPDRTRLEEAPDDLRLVLQKALVERGWVFAYRTVSEALHRIPDPQIWGDSFAMEPARRLILEELEWYEVFDLLEQHADAAQVNASFARTGLAYEMIPASRARGGEIHPIEPVADELEVRGDEAAAAPVLTGDLEPVAAQWKRALTALRGRPADPEKAISEAMGSLEAVAHVLGQGKDFGKNIDALFANEPAWAKALAASLKALYGYTSQVPGARHGRYADPAVAQAEANYVVRVCGSAIAYLVQGRASGRWG